MVEAEYRTVTLCQYIDTDSVAVELAAVLAKHLKHVIDTDIDDYMAMGLHANDTMTVCMNDNCMAAGLKKVSINRM